MRAYELLLEAQDYKSMFNDLLTIYPDDREQVSTNQKIKKEIKWAKSVLRKNNRIVWYLRWVKISWLDDMLNAQNDISDVKDKILV